MVIQFFLKGGSEVFIGKFHQSVKKQVITLSCKLIFSETREGKSRSQPHVTKQPHAHGPCLRLCSQGDPDWNPGFEKNISEGPNMLTHTYTRAHKVHTHAHTCTHHTHMQHKHIPTYLHAHTCKHARQACAQSTSTQHTRVHSCVHWQLPRPRACTPRHTCTSGPWRQAAPHGPARCLVRSGLWMLPRDGQHHKQLAFYIWEKSTWYFRGLHFQRRVPCIHPNFPKAIFCTLKEQIDLAPRVGGIHTLGRAWGTIRARFWKNCS